MSDVSDPATGRPRLLAKPCATCVTHPPNERIALSNERVGEFIRGAVRADSYIVCHSTLYGQGTPAICRGFYDRYSTNPLRIMQRLGGFVEVPLSEVSDGD